MFLRQTEKDLTEKNEKRIQELEIALESIDIGLNESLSVLGLNIEELDAFFSDASNFSEEEWDFVQSTTAELKEKVATPAKPTKSTRGDLPRDPSWISVR